LKCELYSKCDELCKIAQKLVVGECGVCVLWRLADWAKRCLPLFTQVADICTVYVTHSQIHGCRYTSLCGRCIRQRTCTLQSGRGWLLFFSSFFKPNYWL